MSTTERSYGQLCGLARALDLLGDRWTLLIVRELLRGPKRFGDLQHGLEGIGPNLLSARLTSLQDSGVLERATLPGPAPVPGYMLSPRGEALRPILNDLALWGFGLLDENDLAGMRSRAVWAAMTMCARMDHGGKAGPDGIYAFDVEGEQFWLRINDGESTLRDGPPPFEPDVNLTVDKPGFFAVASQTSDPETAGALIEGDGKRLEQLLEVFQLPAGGFDREPQSPTK